MCAGCLFNMFLASQTSLSASSGLRHFHCGFGAHTSFWHVDELPAFPLYIRAISICDMQRDCIRKSCSPCLFLLIWDTMINDSANFVCFIAGVCGLPHSCVSCNEQQVSRCDNMRLFEMLK